MLDWSTLKRAEDIPGWTPIWELMALAHLASETPYLGRILEVGSFCGRATMAMLAGIAGNNHRQIHCIDNWSMSWQTQMFNVPALGARALFNHFTKDAQEGDRVKVFEGDYQIILPTLTARSYHLIFIDGPHEKEHAKPTVDGVLPLIADDGVIAVHDYLQGWAGPRLIIDSLYETGLFKQGVLIGDLAFLQSKPKTETARCQ